MEPSDCVNSQLFSLPVCAQCLLCFFLVCFHQVESICEEPGNAYLSARGLGFRDFASLNTVYNSSGFRNMDDGILKVNIGPLQGQEFSFAQSRVNCQIKKDSQLLRHDSGQGVVANRVRNACRMRNFLRTFLRIILRRNVKNELICIINFVAAENLQDLIKIYQVFIPAFNGGDGST